MEIEELTPREAAFRLGVRLDGVYSLLWARKLKGRKVDGRWLISAADVYKRAQRRTDRRRGSRQL
jgi:excisionase family DNA binding protein